MRALILAPFDERQIVRLSAEMTVTHESWLDTLKLTDPDDLASRIHSEGISVLLVEADFVFEETFSDAPGLRFVGICRASTTQVDVDAATAHDVVVVNTPGRNARAVAEHALGLIFALARRIPTAHSYVTTGNWRHPVGGYVDLRGIELASRTLGIVGMGTIGRILAEMGQALGMSVLSSDPYVTDPPDGVLMVDLPALVSKLGLHQCPRPNYATDRRHDRRRHHRPHEANRVLRQLLRRRCDRSGRARPRSHDQTNRGRGVRRIRVTPHRARQPAL